MLSAGAFSDEVPDIIMSAMGGPDVLAQVVQIQAELQHELVTLSSAGKQIVAEKSGHEIQWYQPELVIDAIRDILEQVRLK